MSCNVDAPACPLRELGTHAAHQRARGLAALTFAALLGSACTATIGSPLSNQSGSTSGSTQSGGTGSTQSGGTGCSSQTGTGSATGMPGPTSTARAKLRLLTPAQGMNSIQSLFG